MTALMERHRERQKASYLVVAGERNVKPPPWKKTTTGRVAAEEEVVGEKRRNQRLRVASTVTSEVVTPSIGLGLGGSWGSKRLKRRRLTVPLERREALRRRESRDVVTRSFHGMVGLVGAAIACGGELTR
ncbi:hypothetical protein V8G54_012093 [Vigna mungo]|uniref:Uncharacterized protein n=1 Tax=Vigna mungo TaxID=3915 RepID=A0AAQ3NTJ3_VIGMU